MTPQSVTDSATDIEVFGPHGEDPAHASNTPVPSTTQMVTVRNRPWVVSEVRASPIVSSDGTRITGKPQHMVSLVSIGDDGFTDRIEVLWELEVGTRIHEGRDLPAPAGVDGFDAPARLDAFLHLPGSV